MEQYNWIRAFYAIHDGDDEREVFVRQEVEGSETFVDDKGKRFHISELDLTRNTFEPQIIPVEKTDSLKWLLESTDDHLILDHKAKIAEREYWRKLRGDIFLEVTRLRLQGTKSTYKLIKDYDFLLNVTSHCFNELYDQDKEFFKNK